MFALTHAAVVLGVHGHVVRAETHIHSGLPAFQIVGLPDAACREARDRVRAAMESSDFRFPMRRITVNLAPSGLRKTGTGLDTAIALGVVAAARLPRPDLPPPDTGEPPEFDWTPHFEGTAVVAELGLDGTLRPVRGLVPLLLALRESPVVSRVVVGTPALPEARLVPGVDVVGVDDLRHLLDALVEARPWAAAVARVAAPPAPAPDLADVRGQSVARAALEIMAAGGHHGLLVGPPGAGKTMLARRLPGLLPPLDDEAAIEVTAIRSAAGRRTGDLVRRPPYRAPHHSATAVALVGGGSAAIRPGEISLAHRGVLFLDELGEFPGAVLDMLRQPLESGVMRVSRAVGSVTFPARFQLLAASNPCPCGDGGTACRCSSSARARYRRRLSGPLLDRFDLRLDMGRPTAAELFSSRRGESTAAVAERVAAVRALAHERGALNARLDGDALEEHAPLAPCGRSLLERAVDAGSLSARGVARIRRVARTIADLAGDHGELTADLVARALLFRSAATDARNEDAA